VGQHSVGLAVARHHDQDVDASEGRQQRRRIVVVADGPADTRSLPLPPSSLEHRHRQILILRCAYVWRSGYVWSQHVVMSKRFGVLVDDEISALAVDNQEGSWTPFEQALIGACDETRTHGEIADSVWAVLAEALSEVQLIDLVFTIGQYALISTALRSLRVELDEPLELPAWEPS
jgi:alkylhydroperoxidase family enzyme